VSDKQYWQSRKLLPQVTVHFGCVADEQIPAVIVSKVAQLVGESAVSTMVVATNNTVSRCCCSCEFGISTGMLAKPMQNLDDLRSDARRVPGQDANLVAVGRAQYSVRWLSQAGSSKSVATCPIHLILIISAVLSQSFA